MGAAIHFGGFIILGVFLTLTAWINGGAIKKYIGELIERETGTTRELIEQEMSATRELIGRIEKVLLKLSDQHEEMIKIFGSMEK
jgi:hypothetical protein